MGSLAAFSQFFTIPYALCSALGIIALSCVSAIVYNLYYSPLAKIPGPKLWAATRLGYVSSILRGNLVHDIWRIHQRYGDVVRLAPDEVSFANGEASHEIFESRDSHPAFRKDTVIACPPPGQAQSLIMTGDHKEHARMARLMRPAFTPTALKAQEPILERHVDVLVDRLRAKATKPETHGDGTVVNIVDWFNFVAFDIVGDLAFGDSFNCLNDGGYHPWVALIFASLKGMTFALATRYYRPLDHILLAMMPRSVVQKMDDHFKLVCDKVHRRLNYEKQRDDFMTPIIQKNADFETMSLAEVESTMSLVTVAGSETTATTLSGTTNELLQSPRVLSKLMDEIRSTFDEESAINVASVKDLPYLNAVISEGLRMCNPVPAGLPRLVPPGGASVCGYWLPKDTVVSVSPYTLSHSSKLFTDVDSFVPERWLSPPHRPAKYDNDQLEALHPFGLGTRACIGQNIAWAEMRLVLARLVWAFDIEAGGEKLLDWRSQKTYFLVEKQPVEVRLKVRA